MAWEFGLGIILIVIGKAASAKRMDLLAIIRVTSYLKGQVGRC